jgi:SAM-dependent methyltransferase
MKTVQDVEAELNIRQRNSPRVSDLDYLHLSDLLLAIAPAVPDAPAEVLDFGCGNSPYRSSFPKWGFRRADFISGDYDYQISPDSRINEKDSSFDVVLTTQVAEHVLDPASYFAECYRLLKKGGKLILSTHGSFEDHAAPYDFQRWTAAGLERDLTKAGFLDVEISKLTTQGRAMLYFMTRHVLAIPASRKTALGMFFYVIGIALQRFRKSIHRQADVVFKANRVVKASDGGHCFYVALLATARK